MIREALEYFASLAQRADEPFEVKGVTEESRVFLVGGQEVIVERCHPSRSHRVDHIDEIAALAKRFKDIWCLPVIWCSPKAVVLVFDDLEFRHNVATMTLNLGDSFRVLAALRANPGAAWKAHKDFVRLLRIDLARTLDPAALLRRVERVRWSAETAITATTRGAKESLDKSMLAEAKMDGEDLPDEVTLNVRVLKNPGEDATYPVRCTVEVDAMEQRFRLLPLPDEIERVESLVVASLIQRLKDSLEDTPVPVYWGSPC